MEHISETAPVLLPQQPEPEAQETRQMKRAFSRAGLSVITLYGAVAQAESIAIVLIVMIAAAWFLGHPLPALDPMELLQNPQMLLDSVNTGGLVPLLLSVFLGVQALAWGVGIVLMRLVLPKGTPIERRSLSFGRFLLIALMCFGVWGAGAALGNLSAFFGVETESLFSVETLGTAALPYLIYAVIGAPIVEELAFRKTLLDGLHDRHEGYAAVISGLLFGLMHGNHMQFFLAFFLGLVFAMVYQRTGRIVYTMLLHGMINLTASLPELLVLAGVDISRGWNIAVGVLIVAGLVALLLMRKDPLLHAAPCTVPDANKAVYRNLGMRIVRIAGLVLVGVQGTLLLLVSMMNTEVDRWGACLIDCIPLALVFLTVLLLPVFTKRYEAKPEPIETEETV